jgi:hypothetical protein
LDTTTDERGQEGISSATLRTLPRDAASQRPIPLRLPSSLTAAGGLLVGLGGLGTWVRATSLPAGSDTPEQVAVVAGRSEPGGWVLLAIGVLLAVAALGRVARTPKLRAVAAGVSVVAMILASVRLALIDRRAARMAEEATGTGGIDAFHAGFGWGAWLILVGAVLLALGLLAGGLRELDIRRGR